MGPYIHQKDTPIGIQWEKENAEILKDENLMKKYKKDLFNLRY
jgi:hypothetical protein